MSLPLSAFSNRKFHILDQKEADYLKQTLKKKLGTHAEKLPIAIEKYCFDLC